MGVDKILFDMEKRALKKEEEAKKKASQSGLNSPVYSTHNADRESGLAGLFIIGFVVIPVLIIYNTNFLKYISDLFHYVASLIGVVQAAIVFGTTALPLGYVFFKIREKKRILYGYLEISFGVCSAILTVGKQTEWNTFSGTNKVDLVIYVALFTSIYIIVRGFDNRQQGKKQIKACEDLLKSSEQNQIDTVKYLLESGVDVNCKFSDGLTPLMLAVDKGNIEVVQLLLNKGAEIELRAKDGTTALKIAEKNKNTELMKLLSAKADSN
jgi:hypothetical protein